MKLRDHRVEKWEDRNYRIDGILFDKSGIQNTIFFFFVEEGGRLFDFSC